MQKRGPGPQAHMVQQRQQALVQAWEALKLHMEQHRAQLEQAHLLARFHVVVRAPSPWVVCMCMCVCVCVCVCVLPGMCMH